MKRVGLLLILFLNLSAGIAQDSLKRGNAMQTQPIEKGVNFPVFEDRMTVLAIGIIAVGGLAFLLSTKRRRADRWSE